MLLQLTFGNYYFFELNKEKGIFLRRIFQFFLASRLNAKRITLMFQNTLRRCSYLQNYDLVSIELYKGDVNLQKMFI